MIGVIRNRFGRRRTGPDPRRGGNPVVLVPGYRDKARVFRRLAHFLEGKTFFVHPLTLVPSDGRAPLDELAGQVKAYVQRTFRPGQRIDFIGFSMGGIVLRYYLQRLGGLERAEHFITLGSPHHGTWMAYGSRRPGVRQMRPGSAFLRDLAGDVERLASVRFTSIWTPFDTMIVPATSSVMPIGRHERLWLPYHRALVTSPRSLRCIATLLREPCATGNCSPHPSPPQVGGTAPTPPPGRGRPGGGPISSAERQAATASGSYTVEP